MASLTLRGVTKRYGDVAVIHGVDLDVADGEFVVFVGPSGCGKSTLLRIICGLDDASAGDIHIDGLRVNEVAAAQRGLALVFQSYALYPHMTVRQNMAFGLENLRMPRAVIDARIGEAARMLRLEPYLARRPTALSGGQRQRVAIGRAIVREPRIFLFDEPLSNLDAELRVAMRAELSALHRRLATTMIYVTHDQVEAMTMADKIVVLRAGRVEQVGAPLALYNHPANQFVAGFIGSPRMNFLPGMVDAEGRIVVDGIGGGGRRAACRPARRYRGAGHPARAPGPATRRARPCRRSRAVGGIEHHPPGPARGDGAGARTDPARPRRRRRFGAAGRSFACVRVRWHGAARSLP